MVGKGLAGDELTERQYLVIDGIDGRAHYVEFAEPDQLDDVRRGGIVEVGPPRPAPEPWTGPSLLWPATVSTSITRASMSHKRDRRSACRMTTMAATSRRMCAGWKPCGAPALSIPEDFEQRAAEYDAQRRRTLSVRVL